MRQLAIFLIALFTTIGSLVAILGTKTIQDFELRGYIDPTQDEDIPFAVPRLGVNADLSQYTAKELQSNLDLMQESNVVWVRQFAYWDEIEPQQNQYDWSQWDAIIEAVRNYNDLELVVVLMNSPEWARTQSPDQAISRTGPPHSPQDFAEFAHIFATRYGEVVDYYQIWDEPNLDDAWGLLDPRPTEYIALLSEVYTAIHNADPSATVIAAALAPTTENSGQNMSDIRYLQTMYQRGAKEVMDVVAAKPYGFSRSALDRTVDANVLNFSRIVALREVMVANGDGKKSLWASHWGWNHLPDDWQGEASIWGEVTQQEQIQFTTQTLDRVHRELPWLGAMILHHWQPNQDVDNPQWGFTLIDQNDRPTPLLEAIQKYNFPEFPQNGLFHPRTTSARYSGVWTFSNLGADIGWLETTDSQLEFDFEGTEVALLLREGDYVAFLYPTIDNEQANATPRDTNGNAYVFLRSDSAVDPESLAEEINLIPISRNLSHDHHTLKVIADKGWDQWAIAGFAVSSGNLSQAYENQITIGILSLIVSASVLILSAIQTPWQTIIPSTTIIFRGISSTSHVIASTITSVAMMLAMFITWSTARPNILIRDDINLIIALITGGLLYLSPSFIITVVCGLVLFILFYYRLETGLILTLLWTPFFLFPIELYTFSFPIAEVMILITAGAWLLQLSVKWGTQLQMQNSNYHIVSLSNVRQSVTTIDVGILGMIMVALISLLWTQRMGVAITELRTFILEPFLFYVIFRSIRPTRTTLLHLVDTLIISATLVALIGLIMFIQGEGIITAEAGAKRLASVYGSPNNVGLLLGRAIPFVLAYVLVSVDRNRRFFAGICLLIMGVALALTQSVGAILLGIPAAIVVILLALYRKRSIIPIMATAILGGAGFGILTQISARFANLLDFTSGTNFFRLRVWESAIEIIEDNPITGIGLDQFLYRFSGEYIRPDAIWDRDLSHPHNFILDLWTRLGIVGVMLFFVIQFSFWRLSLSLLKRVRENHPIFLAVVIGLMGSMADLLIHGLIDNSIFVNDLAMIFMFQLGLLVNLANIRFIDE